MEGILLWTTYYTCNNHWWHTRHCSSKLKTAQQEKWPGNMTSGVLLSCTIWNDKIRNQTIQFTVQSRPPVIIFCSKTWKHFLRLWFKNSHEQGCMYHSALKTKKKTLIFVEFLICLRKAITLTGDCTENENIFILPKILHG